MSNRVHELQGRIEAELGADAWLIGCESDFGLMLEAMVQRAGRSHRDVEMEAKLGMGYISKILAAYRPKSKGKRWTRKTFAMGEDVFFLLEELGYSIVVLRKDRAHAEIELTGTLRGPRARRGRAPIQMELPWGALPSHRRSSAQAEAIVEAARALAQLKKTARVHSKRMKEAA